MDFGLEAFKQSKLGQEIEKIITERDNVLVMTAFGDHNIPAVQAVGKHILALDMPVTDDDKKKIGRWVREVMEKEGWTPVRKGRVAAGNLFSTGAIYERKAEREAA